MTTQNCLSAPHQQMAIKSRQVDGSFELKMLYDAMNMQVSECNPFLNYHWQQSWVSTLARPITLLEFWLDETLVGFAFLGVVENSRFSFFKRVLLNQTGKHRYDQVWIEFNDIICHDEHKERCASLLLTYVFEQNSYFRFEASYLSETTHWRNAALALGLTFDESHVPSFEHVFSENSIESAFSSNTRSQIRRAIKKVTSEFGELSISAAVDSELVNHFHALGTLHISQWGETPEGSGFQNPAFVKHHETILNLAPSSVEILQVRAGDTLVGYGYYLIHNRRAYFYCSGINFDIATNSIKPGYLLHYLAMCHFSEQGLLSYDFLGGDYRYKKSLSNHNYDFTTMTFFSSSLVAKVLEAANRVIKKCTNLMVSSHQNESV